MKSFGAYISKYLASFAAFILLLLFINVIIFVVAFHKTVTEDYLKTLEDARDNNEEEMGVTIGDEFYTLSQLYPDSVMDYYREHGGAVHLEYVYGNAYTIFGQVIEGMDVVDAIAAVKVDENAKPLEDVIINSITFEPYTAQ